MIAIRCKECNKELIGHNSKAVSCGCPNMAMIRGDRISANDLTRIVMLNSNKEPQNKNPLPYADVAWQEARKNRKIRKLDFEVR